MHSIIFKLASRSNTTLCMVLHTAAYVDTRILVRILVATRTGLSIKTISQLILTATGNYLDFYYTAISKDTCLRPNPVNCLSNGMVRSTHIKTDQQGLENARDPRSSRSRASSRVCKQLHGADIVDCGCASEKETWVWST